MRDRLIELIESARYWGAGTSAEMSTFLLANGVIVPPCKVGDYVKVIGDSKVWRVDALHFYREGLPQISITNKKVTKTMFFETFETFMEVLTSEQAEKALAERGYKK